MALDMRPLYDMSDDDLAAFKKRRNAAMADMVAEQKVLRARRAVQPKPTSRRRGDQMICMPMVILERRRAGIKASADGSEQKSVFLPFKAAIEVYQPFGSKWAAVTMPRWLRNSRQLHTINRSQLPPAAPGPVASHPDFEAYRLTEDGERCAVDEHVRRENDRFRPERSFSRKSYGGSTW